MLKQPCRWLRTNCTASASDYDKLDISDAKTGESKPTEITANNDAVTSIISEKAQNMVRLRSEEPHTPSLNYANFYRFSAPIAKKRCKASKSVRFGAF